MKITRYPFLLAGVLLVACQHSAPPAEEKATAAIAPVPASKEAAPPQATTSTDSLTPDMRAMLRQVNLTRLFLAPASQDEGFKTALDGFFGTNPQRLSLAILEASRDSLKPELIHVVGRVRNRKQVSAFTGDIRLTRITDYYDQQLLLSQGEEGFIQDTSATGDGAITNARAYAAAADFRFTSSTPGAYQLTGSVFLDFWLMQNGTVGTLSTPGEGIVLEQAATKGAGLLVKGNWQDLTAHTTQPFIVGRDVFLLSPALIKDFGIGDRGAQVNPKYAKLGWSNYWENDEWWADSPKPKLSL